MGGESADKKKSKDKDEGTGWSDSGNVHSQARPLLQTRRRCADWALDHVTHKLELDIFPFVSSDTREKRSRDTDWGPQAPL